MEQTEKKKILIAVTKSNFGGAQRYVFDLATHLSSKEFDVSVVCGGTGLLTEKLREKNIQTHTIPFFLRDVSLTHDVRAFLALLSLIRSQKPDILHLNSSKMGILGAIAGRVAGVPRIVFTAHGWPFFEDRSLIARFCIWKLSLITTVLSHAVIVVSRHDKTHARQFGLSKKVHYIPLAVQSDARGDSDTCRRALFDQSTIERHARDIWVVSIAEYTKNKNLLFAIRAVEEFNMTHARKILYTLIGEGEDRAVFEEYINTRGIGDQIILKGYVKDASHFLPAFDICVLPSIKEGLPYVLLEAGVAGVPCIASNRGGIPDIIHDHATGLLIDPRAQHSLVDALDFASENQGRMKDYATNLSRLVKTTYTDEAFIRGTFSVYSSRSSRA